MRWTPSHREPRVLKSGEGMATALPASSRLNRVSEVGRAGFPRYRDAHPDSSGCV